MFYRVGGSAGRKSVSKCLIYQLCQVGDKPHLTGISFDRHYKWSLGKFADYRGRMVLLTLG